VDLAKVQTVTTNIIIEDMVYTALFLKVVLQFRFTFTFGNCVARRQRLRISTSLALDLLPIRLEDVSRILF
jgi:hypothetical protein